MATEEQKSTDEERDDAQASSAGDDRDDLEGRSSDASGSSASSSDDGSTSDDGSSADEGSVDEPATDTRDEDDDEGDAGEAAAVAASGARAAADRSVADRSAAERASAGARLAAAKAAKAAKKAARKAREQAESGTVPAGMTGGASKPADEVLAESVVGQAASKASDWAQNNRPIALGIAAIALVGLLGWAGWTWYTSSQARAAGTLLAAAIEIANAEIRPEGEAAEDAEDGEDEEPTYATQEERARAALEAYQRVVSEHGGTEAARWARLGVAWAHFQLGEMEPAREAYEQTLREAGGDPVIAWRALEGMGFTYEATQQWDEAIAKYEELGHVEDGAYSAPADYHTARMHIAKGETVEATTQLRALIERLRTDSESGEPDFPFVLAQAEIRLRELDPTTAGPSAPSLIGPGGGGGGGDGMPAGLEGLPPEILEQLRRQIQEQGAAGGAPGEAGGGGGE